jgi:hypothetical protein
MLEQKGNNNDTTTGIEEGPMDAESVWFANLPHQTFLRRLGR